MLGKQKAPPEALREDNTAALKFYEKAFASLKGLRALTVAKEVSLEDADLQLQAAAEAQSLALARSHRLSVRLSWPLPWIMKVLTAKSQAAILLAKVAALVSMYLNGGDGMSVSNAGAIKSSTEFVSLVSARKPQMADNLLRTEVSKLWAEAVSL